MAIVVGPPLVTLDLTIGQVENLNPQGQAQSGINTGVTLNTADTGITLSSGGVIKGGQTAFNTGNGFFLGYTGAQYKVSIGDPSGDNLTWDGADLTITADAGTISGDLTVNGNFTVNGTTTTLNTATLDVEDKNITLNYGSGDTSSTANGAGITIQDAVSNTTDASILWNGATDAFDFSNSVNVTGNIVVSGNVDGRDVATDGDKLDNIEALADVTDTTNVTAAGALMDSELTDLTAVKSLDQGVATTDTPTFAGLATSADVTFGDNDKAIFGAGSDLQIYHASSQSYIEDAGSGNLNFKSNGNNFNFLDGSDNVVMQIDIDSETTLYHNTSAKLATSSSGIDVTGTVTADGLTVNSGSTNTVATFQSTDSTVVIPLIDSVGSTQIRSIDGAFAIRTGGDGGSSANTAERMRIDASGRVGIGTTPDAATVLHVQATEPQVLISDASNPLQRFMAFDVGLAADEDTHFITVDQADALAFGEKLNGNDRVIENEWMRITNVGRVGIGTSSPAEPLHVQEGSSGITSKAGTVALIEGSANTKVSIASGTTSTGELLFGSSADNDAGRVIYDHSDDGLQLWTNGARAVDLDSSGNLLVNGTNATAKLVVDGDANTYTTRVNSSATTGQAFGTRIRAGTNSSDYALLVENTSAASMLAVRGDGNVGIGTSSPSFPLEVDGGTGDGIKIKAGNTSNDDSFLVANTSNTTMFLVDGGGNVGIGTSSPATHLHVQGSSGEIRVQDTGSGGGIVSFRDNGTSSIPSIQSSGNNLLVNTGGSERMRLDASGNLLVGTTETDIGFTASGAGCMLAPEGTLQLARDSANELLYLNKLGGNDGDIIRLSTDGNEIGVLGVRANYIKIGNGDTQLLFNSGSDAITPEGLTANRDAAIDLGRTVSRFKDLYLSGGVRGTSTIDITIPETSGGAINLEFGNNTNTTRRTVQAYKDNFEPAAADTGVISLGQAGNQWKNLYLSGGVVFGATSGNVSSKTLDDYEEGTFTGAVADASSGGNESSSALRGTYVKVGALVYVQFNVSNISTTGMTAGNDVFITGLPFASKSVSGTAKYTGTANLSVVTFEQTPFIQVNEGGTFVKIMEIRSGAGNDAVVVSQLSSGASDIHGNLVYETA